MESKTYEFSDDIVSHVSLTHFMRRNWQPNALQDIVALCDVNPDVGVLPPELRCRIPQDKIAEYTARFHEILHNFITKNYHKIRNADEYALKPMPDLAEMFGTHCTIEYHGMVPRKWSGTFGVVCRISFPMIGANYALKIFYKNLMMDIASDTVSVGHGKLFEIPTAFAATHCEPRDNAPVYLASFADCGYMLSKWCWQTSTKSNICRNNRNKIFFTNNVEFSPRNYAQYRRIDYGKTFQTAYGAAPYPVRKMCRQIINMAQQAQKSDNDAARATMSEFLDAPRGYLARRDFAHAMDIVRAIYPELLSGYER